jgi:hypothetical protein
LNPAGPGQSPCLSWELPLLQVTTIQAQGWLDWGTSDSAFYPSKTIDSSATFIMMTSAPTSERGAPFIFIISIQFNVWMGNKISWFKGICTAKSPSQPSPQPLTPSGRVISFWVSF